MNDENLKKGEATRFKSGEEAVRNGQKGGIKSGEVRRENKLIRDRILERMKETDWDEYIDGIIERAKASDKGAEFLRDTVGQKPSDKVDVSANVSATMTDIQDSIIKDALEIAHGNGRAES